MDSRVENFIEAITNGTDVETATRETGIGEMNTHDVLIEIAKGFK